MLVDPKESRFEIGIANGLDIELAVFLGLWRATASLHVAFQKISAFHTGWLALLCLQSCFYHIYGVGDHSGHATTNARAEEVPKKRVGTLPGLDRSLQVFIHDNDGRSKRDVHQDSKRIASVQTLQSFLLEDL